MWKEATKISHNALESHKTPGRVETFSINRKSGEWRNLKIRLNRDVLTHRLRCDVISPSQRLLLLLLAAMTRAHKQPPPTHPHDQKRTNLIRTTAQKKTERESWEQRPEKKGISFVIRGTKRGFCCSSPAAGTFVGDGAVSGTREEASC